jgi:nitrate/nitrite-specific signal transduction histidine kinase
MHIFNGLGTSLQKRRFISMTIFPSQSSAIRRLTLFYICALCSVALLSILGQIIIQMSIQQQSSDALVINIAGRQRMLSQKIPKDALILETTTDPAVRKARTQELQQAVTLWQQSQQGLQNGDAKQDLPPTTSPTVKQLFSVIEPNYTAMLSAVQDLLTELNQQPASSLQRSTIASSVDTILAQEGPFLIGMNNIVTQYQLEAEGRVSSLRVTELFLMAITLIVLVIEGSFVFRPTTHKLQQTIQEIVALQAAITKQKQELEDGIQQILDTHVHVANGDFTTRAPLTQDHLLWQIAHSLNTLVARLQRLSQAETELQQTKLEFRQQMGSTQAQAQQTKAELQQIYRETQYLVETLRDAKLRERPIRVSSSRTFLDPLCRELAGNYLQPALPAPNA